MSSGNSIKRQDGRSDTEIREIEIAFNELERADGSARFAFGGTGSLASFSGPMEVRLQKDQATRATLEVVHRPLEGIGATPSRAIESSLQALLPPLLNLGLHPRSLIQLIVQSLSTSKLPSTSSSTYSSSYSAPTEIDLSQRTWPSTPPSDDESDEEIVYNPNENQSRKAAPTTSIPYSSRASGINATALSILSAGSLALSAIPIALAVALLPLQGGSTLVLDPTMEEEVKATARFGFGWAISSTGAQGDMDVDEDEGLEMELVWVESEGSFSRAEFAKAMEMSKVGAREIWGIVREAAAEHVEKTVR